MKAAPPHAPSHAPLSDDLRTLYQEIILDHGKHPRNFRVVEHASCKAQGNNPMCGDRVTVTARVRDGRIDDIAFEGKGCAISVASASMMTDALKGQPLAAVRRLFDAVHDLCTGKAEGKAEGTADAEGRDGAFAPHLEKLAALSGVRQFPVRVKCATLPWHALMSCLEDKATASTEQ